MTAPTTPGAVHPEAISDVSGAAPGLTRGEWLAERRKGIGGSDIAAILGLSTYRTPLQVWLDKVHGDDEAERPEWEWGRRLEDVVAQKWAEEHPDVTVYAAPQLIWDDLEAVAFASPDRLLSGGGVLELKTADSRVAHRWDDDQVPDEYVMQLMWYLGVTGAQHGWIACLIGGRRYVEREFARDDRLIEAMRTRAAQWWADHVVAMVPPPAVPPDDDRYMARAYPATERTEVALDADTLNLVEQARSTKGVIDNLSDDHARLVTLIKERLGTATDGIGPDGAPVVTWRPRKGSTRLDTARLKAEHPDLYAALTSAGEPTRTFRLIDPKD